MSNWPFTNLGVKFFEGTMPSLVRAIQDLARELKRQNDREERSSDSSTSIVSSAHES
jgi:hypothetical protein